MYTYKRYNYKKVICVRHVCKIKGYLMHNSDAIFILNCAFVSPCCFYTWGPQIMFIK